MFGLKTFKRNILRVEIAYTSVCSGEISHSSCLLGYLKSAKWGAQGSGEQRSPSAVQGQNQGYEEKVSQKLFVPQKLRLFLLMIA